MRHLAASISPTLWRSAPGKAGAGLRRGLAPAFCGRGRLRGASVFRPTDWFPARRWFGGLSRPGLRGDRSFGRALQPGNLLPSGFASEVVAEPGAAANCSGASHRLLPPPSPPAAFPQPVRRASAVAELGSFGDFARAI
jgi:hypothetical protein